MAACTTNEEVLPASTDSFALTQWNLVLAAARRSAPEAEQALAKLYDTYWKPIYAYVRRRGYSAPEAEDLTQSYFVRLLEKNFLRDAKSERGKVETFLLASLKNFLANEWDRAHAQKRGGQHQIVSLDEITSSGNPCPLDSHSRTPEEQFERQWALTALNRAIVRLGEEYLRAGKARLFEWLRDFLTEDDKLPYKQVSAALEMSEGAVKTAVHRLRSRLRNLLRAEIAETLSHSDDPGKIDEEIRFLIKTLRS